MKIEVFGNCTLCNNLHDILEDREVEHDHIINMKEVHRVARENGVMYQPIVLVDNKILVYSADMVDVADRIQGRLK
jgi:predicted thioredoxin/glutaredoxin